MKKIILFEDETSKQNHLVYIMTHLPTELLYIRFTTFAKVYSKEKDFEKKLKLILNEFLKSKMILSYEIENELKKVSFSSDGNVFGSWKEPTPNKVVRLEDIVKGVAT